MSAKSIRLIFSILMALALIGVSGCGTDANGQDIAGENDAEKKDKVDIVVPVESSTVESRTVNATYSGTANLESEKRVSVVTKTSGIVLKILVEEGDMVKRGQVLALLESDRHRLDLKQAEVVLKRMQREFKRIGNLQKKKMASLDEYEKSGFDVEEQEAKVAIAGLDLSYTEIRASISGVVTERMIKTGALVAISAEVFKIANFDPLIALLHVPEKELPRLRKGQLAELAFDALPGTKFSGSVARISPVIDADSGTFRLVVEMDSNASLRPGMFGRVAIIYESHKDAVVVHRDAVLTEDGKDSVFVIEENVVQRQPIETGIINGNWVEVLSGISSGTAVVTAGKNSLADGSKVEVIGVVL